MTFLALSGLCKAYGSVTALSDVDLTVTAASRTAIVGPSGSGKTTLLRIIAGFEAPDRGRVKLDGELLADGPTAEPAYRRGIGVVMQDGALFPHLSVADNIGFGLPRAAPRRAEQIAALMDMVELDRAMLPRRPDQLSGGQQQRVALARALACKPRLMLLDEPFSALDAGLRVTTRKAVADLLAREKIATILVTHDQEEALSFADQVAIMRDGRLLQVGTPRTLYLRPADPMIASFLGDAIVLPAEIANGFAECALGRVDVDASARRGKAEIMLRPEQIALAPASGREQRNGEAIGQVFGVDLVGSSYKLCVRVVEGTHECPSSEIGTGATFHIRRSLVENWSVGDLLTIGLLGQAHIF